MKKNFSKKIVMVIQNSAGFTLVEVLVASFIFASVLAVVYGLLNDTLVSKKELELSLTINEQIKNTNEVLQSVMREASGDFFTDAEFKTDPNNNPATLAHLFFVSGSYKQPDVMNAPLDYASSTVGKYLYVKDNKNEEKKIYIFRLESDSSGIIYSLFLESWKKGLNDSNWSVDQNKTQLLTNIIGSPQFEIAKSIYTPNNGELAPMNLYARLHVIVKKPWKNTTLIRELNQIYIPLIISNPYI